MKKILKRNNEMFMNTKIHRRFSSLSQKAHNQDIL